MSQQSDAHVALVVNGSVQGGDGTEGSTQPTSSLSNTVPVPSVPAAPLLCRIGQETAQEIVNKTMELFQYLRHCIPPNGTAQATQTQEDRKAKIAETLRVINFLFRKLRKIYEKVNEVTNEMEFLQVESLIPLKDHHRQEDKKNPTQVIRRLNEERSNVKEQLRIRNKQLKDIIDMLRDIVWDINTMLSMRKP